jgi:hypothetical protein
MTILDNDPIFFILRGPALPSGKDAGKLLGRIVRNFAQPLGGGYYPDDGSVYHLDPPTETAWSNAETVLDVTTAGKLTLKASSLISGEANTAHISKLMLKNTEIRTFELQKQPDVYRKMLQNEEARAWILENCRKPLYMITGILVWRDAITEEEKSDERDYEAQVKVSTGAAVSAAALSQGALIRPDAVGNVTLGGTRLTATHRTQKKESEQEQVFAISYGTIRRRKLDVFRGFEPVLGPGPRVAADRTFSETSKLANSDGQQIAPEMLLPELELDVDWTDIAQMTPEDGVIDVESVGNTTSDIRFVVLE